MTHEEIVKRIRESIRKEESSARVYYRHLRTVLLRSSLPQNVKEDLRTTVERIVQDDMTHKKILHNTLTELGEKEDDQ